MEFASALVWNDMSLIVIWVQVANNSWFDENTGNGLPPSFYNYPGIVLLFYICKEPQFHFSSQKKRFFFSTQVSSSHLTYFPLQVCCMHVLFKKLRVLMGHYFWLDQAESKILDALMHTLLFKYTETNKNKSALLENDNFILN